MFDKVEKIQIASCRSSNPLLQATPMTNQITFHHEFQGFCCPFLHHVASHCIRRLQERDKWSESVGGHWETVTTKQLTCQRKYGSMDAVAYIYFAQKETLLCFDMTLCFTYFLNARSLAVLPRAKTRVSFVTQAVVQFLEYKPDDGGAAHTMSAPQQLAPLHRATTTYTIWSNFSQLWCLLQHKNQKKELRSSKLDRVSVHTRI